MSCWRNCAGCRRKSGPGTADLGKQLRVHVRGDTPGTSAGRGSCAVGTFATSARRSAAIWLRAPSSTVVSAVTVTLVSVVPTVSGSAAQRRTRRGSTAGDIHRTPEVNRDLAGPTFRCGDLKRPASSVVASRVRLVWVWRATTSAPGTAAPWSVTRPPSVIDGICEGPLRSQHRTQHQRTTLAVNDTS